MNIPADLKYTASHEWVRLEADGTVTVGITEYAQDALGDIVFVELPDVGATFTAGDDAAVVESVKAASDIYAPLSGEVTEVNQAVADAPESINADAYANWLFKLKPSDANAINGLLDAGDPRIRLQRDALHRKRQLRHAIAGPLADRGIAETVERCRRLRRGRAGELVLVGDPGRLGGAPGKDHHAGAEQHLEQAARGAVGEDLAQPPGDLIDRCPAEMPHIPAGAEGCAHIVDVHEQDAEDRDPAQDIQHRDPRRPIRLIRRSDRLFGHRPLPLVI